MLIGCSRDSEDIRCERPATCGSFDRSGMPRGVDGSHPGRPPRGHDARAKIGNPAVLSNLGCSSNPGSRPNKSTRTRRIVLFGVPRGIIRGRRPLPPQGGRSATALPARWSAGVAGLHSNPGVLIQPWTSHKKTPRSRRAVFFMASPGGLFAAAGGSPLEGGRSATALPARWSAGVAGLGSNPGVLIRSCERQIQQRPLMRALLYLASPGGFEPPLPP